jgi:Uma2 family endonuclease
MHTVESAPKPVRGASIWPLSVPAYHALGEAGLIPERTELLYGFVYHKMPKSPFHSWLVVRLIRLVRAALGKGFHVRSEQPITAPDSEPEPDVAVIRGEEDDFRHEHPHTAELVMEVCVTSHEYDRSKLHAYASAGVKECWLVLGPEKQVEVHRSPAGNQFSEREVHGPGGVVRSAALPGFTLNLDAFFAEKASAEKAK